MVTKFEEVDAVIKKAQNGDADAQFELGKLFSEGKIIVQNYGSAFYWFTKACEQNHAKAFQYLGNCYLCGEGVQIDREKALEHFLIFLSEVYMVFSASLILWLSWFFLLLRLCLLLLGILWLFILLWLIIRK